MFGVAADGAGNLLIADNATNRIRVVAARTGTFYRPAMTAGDIYTVAGDGAQGSLGNGGPATKAELNAPGGVAAGPGGTLVIADTGNDWARVVASRDGTFYGITMKAGGIHLPAGGRANPGTDGLGDGAPAVAATLNQPIAVAADGAGGLLIADTGDNRVRLVTGT